MNYYRRHIGDYIRDTSHLSLLEHGVYVRLMDVYYTREDGIPVETAARIIGARTEEEREAVAAVLAEFFTKDGDVWRQPRCDREITEYHEKAERNRESGKLGGRPQKPRNNPDGFQAEPTDNPNQKPIANSQKPVGKKPPNPPPGFDAFWSAYPNTSGRKVNKAGCLRLWIKDGLERRAEAVVAHLEAMKVTDQWRGGFEPSPQTYLSQQRYETPPPVERRPVAHSPPTAPARSKYTDTIEKLTNRNQPEVIDVTATEFYPRRLAG